MAMDLDMSKHAGRGNIIEKIDGHPHVDLAKARNGTHRPICLRCCAATVMAR